MIKEIPFITEEEQIFEIKTKNLSDVINTIVIERQERNFINR